MKINKLKFNLSAMALAITLSMTGCNNGTIITDTKEIIVTDAEENQKIQDSYDIYNDPWVDEYRTMSMRDINNKGIGRLSIIGKNIENNESISEEEFVKILEEVKQYLDDKEYKFIHSLKITDVDLNQYSEETQQLFREIILSLNYIYSIKLENTSINDISFLKDCTFKESLASLTLENCGIEDISSLSDFTSLNYLNLDKNRIEDIHSLFTCHSLEVLRLSNNNITDVTPLAKSYHLRHLTLRDNNITNADSLISLPDLEFLCIKGNDIANIDYFIQALQTSNSEPPTISTSNYIYIK